MLSAKYIIIYFSIFWKFKAQVGDMLWALVNVVMIFGVP